MMMNTNLISIYEQSYKTLTENILKNVSPFKTFIPAAAAPVRLRTSTAPEMVNFDHEDKKGTRSYENVDHHR